MESLGEKLRTARNEKGFTIDQVSRETNISIRYLEAMETENFSIFPGEPYIIGFLRNYSSYLDLDVQKVISLYRSLRIQEQPVPVEQLLRKQIKLPKFLLPVLLILVLLGLAGWGVYYLIQNNRNNQSQSAVTVRSPVEYIMDGNSIERRLYRNDSVLVTIDFEIYKIELFNLGEALTIRTPGGVEILDLGQEAIIDLNNDGIQELRITVVDFAKNNADMGALLHFYLMDAAVFTSTSTDTDSDNAVIEAASGSVITTIIPPTVSAYPFTLQIVFQGYCMFRWEILNERDRAGSNQRYFQRGEPLDISAQNGIRLWASNAQAARFQVIGGGRTYPVEVGSPGEVIVADIRWVRDEDGRYRLILIRLET